MCQQKLNILLHKVLILKYKPTSLNATMFTILKDIPILTIHDSYIIQSNFTGELRKVMNQSISDELGGFKINIKQEGIGSAEVQAKRNIFNK